MAAADPLEDGLAELDAQLSPDEPDDIEPVEVPEVAVETVAAADADPAASPEPSTRPAFTMFRRTGAGACSGRGHHHRTSGIHVQRIGRFASGDRRRGR